MLYFQVLPTSSQVRTARPKGDTLVPNELYTATEVLKLGVNAKNFKLVTVPKNNTFYSFGARFSSQTGTYLDCLNN